MATGFDIVIKANRISEVTTKIGVAIAKAVEETARNIEAAAKAKAPVRTGFLRNSVGSELTGPTSARVHVDAEYAPYVNFGTRSMAPRPFFTQAIEEERPRFLARIVEAGKSVR